MLRNQYTRRGLYLVATMIVALLTMNVGQRDASSQSLYGTITGNVSDPSGSAIQTTTVVAIRSLDQKEYTVSGNDSGGFNLADVLPGDYIVRISAPGFRVFETSGVHVTTGTVRRIDAQLVVGSTSESVTVGSAPPVLQTEQSDVQDAIESQTIESLPMPIGRNYQGELRTLPGFSVTGGGAVRGSNPAAAFQMNVNGVPAELNNTRIDGASATNNFGQGLTSYIPGLEAIQSVQVSSNSQGADTGLVGGASVNVQIKSGGNQIHGSAFEYHTDNVLKAKPAVFPITARKPKLIYNQFGGTFGGPIIKDKLFYFASYDGVLSRQSYSTFATVPTAAAKSGNLSESATPIYDPSTGNADGSGRTPFTGNQIPLSRFSAISQKILPLWPDPNLTGLANNYFASASSPYNRHTIDGKVNYNANKKLTLSARLGFLDWSEYYVPVFGTKLGGRTISGQQSGNANGHSVSLTGAVTYVLRPTLILDGYFGYNLSYQNVLPVDIDQNVGLDFLGIPGTNGTRKFEGGWPLITLVGYDGVGVDQPYMPWIRHDPGYNYVGNFNWTKQSHSIRFGGEFSRRDLNHAQPEIEGQIGGAAGGFVFSQGVTQTLGGPASNSDNTFAAFLLGLPQQTGTTLQVPDQIQLRSNFYGTYIQDRWAITPRLTANFGVRYEYLPLPNRPDRGVEFYNPANNTQELCGFNTVSSNCDVSMVKTGFSPHLGISYRAAKSLIVRAGFAIARDPYDIGPRGVRTNYPLMIAQNYVGANTYTPVEDWKVGIPKVTPPAYGSGIISVPSTVVVHAIPRNFNRGYIESRNLSIQKEFGDALVIQASYIGTLVIHQVTKIDLNAGQTPGAGIAGEPLFAKFGRVATTPEYVPIGTTNYNGLQVRIQSQPVKGLSLAAGYTWSKAIGSNTASSVEAAPIVNAFAFFSKNRGVMDYDRTQVLNVSGTWDLPFGKGRQFLDGGVGSKVFGGWNFAGILTAMTGLPFSVTASNASLNMPGTTQLADQVGTFKVLGGHRVGNPYFDTTSFTAVTTARLGTSSRNEFRGPRLVNLDSSVSRDFAIKESVHLQFRAEAFNISNTPHWALPGANVSAGGFGIITNTDSSYLGRAGTDERQLRVGLKASF